MKFFISVTITILISYLAGAFLPWWCIFPLAAIIYAWIPLKHGYAFLSGFLSLFLLWGVLAFLIDSANHHLLSKKITMLFLQNEKYGYLILITGFIGGVTGGFSALTGSLARRLLLKK